MRDQKEAFNHEARDGRIQQVIDRLVCGHHKKLTVKNLAKDVGMSYGHFERVFKTETGKTPKEYLIGTRIEEAKPLLVKLELMIEQIAEQVGYSDPKRFRKDFKKHTGLLPSEYRKLRRSTSEPPRSD